MILGQGIFRAVLLSATAFVLLSLGLRGGTVTLLSGDILRGQVKLERGRIVVQKDGSDRSVGELELWYADFQDPGYAGEPGPREAQYQEYFTQPGVLLVNGSFLGGDIKSFTPEQVTVSYGESREKTFDLKDVARVNFKLAPVVNALIPPGVQGVVLQNGSFVEGEFIKYEDGRVHIDSLVFGPNSFTDRQMQGVVLQDFATVSSGYVVTAKDGTRLLTGDIDINGDTLEAEDPFLGEFRLSSDYLASISVGSRRLRDVSGMNYIRRAPVVENEDDLAIRSNPTTAAPLVVDPVERVITMPAGNAMAVMADETYRGFVSRIAVPENLPPSQQVVFQVRADRRIAFRSQPMNSQSPVQVVTVRDPVRQYLILEVLPVSDQTMEAPGLWIEPSLVRE